MALWKRWGFKESASGPGMQEYLKKIYGTQQCTPEIEVDPETYEVKVDGEIITCEPLKVLPMAQRYFLF